MARLVRSCDLGAAIKALTASAILPLFARASADKIILSARSKSSRGSFEGSDFWALLSLIFRTRFREFSSSNLLDLSVLMAQSFSHLVSRGRAVLPTL